MTLLTDLVLRTTFMVGTIVLAFLTCWFPFAVMFTLSPFNDDNILYDNKDLVTWLGNTNHTSISSLSKECPGYANSFLNPLIYAIMYPAIRAAMRKQIENVFC